jgi:hypothetical protein
MLGREEEMLEREEVERQLREVEVQERMAAEGGELLVHFVIICFWLLSSLPPDVRFDRRGAILCLL